MPPAVRDYLFSLSITEACKLLKPSPRTRYQLVKRCGLFDWREFVLPLSLIYKELTAAAKEELQELAERKLFHDHTSPDA